MVFSSVMFLFRFLPIFFLIYFLVPGRGKNVILFLGSLIFYAWGEPVYVVLMLFSTVVDYVNGRLIGRFRGRAQAKFFLVFSVVINLFILCFFKYADFLIQTVNNLTGASLPLLNLPLPIGISFYTFQTMSYTIDVYRSKAKVQKSILDFGVYVTMFPQLIAGPIVKYSSVEENLHNRKTDMVGISRGVKRFVAGLAKKALLANTIGELWAVISAMEFESISVFTAWIGIFAFAFQIYFDFSGYSDMAIGLGKMFGFELKENFAHPYCARSITEFWRRWHISLGSWFREYVYIPLGGNRVGILRHILNLLLVWALTGLWHGASWSFVVWGLYYGVLLILEKYLLHRVTEQIPVVGTMYAMILVIVGWVFFFSPTLSEAVSYLGAMAGIGVTGITDDAGMYYLLTSLVLFWLSWVFATPAAARFSRQAMKKPNGFTPFFMAAHMGIFLVAVAYLIHDTYNPFLYFRF